MTTHSGWRRLAFDECVVTAPVARKPSIPQSKYKPEGPYPIIDQGSSLIAGYTDDAQSVYGSPLPIILFGDHTRVLKYLDFPFATGADGTKLIFPNLESVDPRFLFYALKALNLEGRGYNRHYSILREREILAPCDLRFQCAIASVLLKIQAAVETQNRIVTNLKELKAATMARVFREGLNKGRFRQTEIGWIPEGWDVVELGSQCRISSGGTPSRDNPDYWNGKIPWVKTGEIDYRRITQTEEHISDKGLEDSAAKIFPRGTVLMAMYGQGVTRGRVAILDIEAATNQACAALIPGENLDVGFLYFYCAYAYDRIRELGHGANQKNLSLDILKRLRIPLPKTKDEQHRIAKIFQRVDDQIDTQERLEMELCAFFTAMLHLLTAGAVRIPKALWTAKS